MALPPAKASLFPAGTIGPATAKTLFGQWYDYIFALLGADGTAEKAREAMNIALPNWLMNPDGEVYFEAVAATADDTYMDEGWYALTQTSTITPSQVSAPEDGYRYGLRLTQSQATAQRMGRAQIMKGRDAFKLRGKVVTFGGRLKLSASANVRMAILAWTGTEDVVTSDVVGNWTSGSYTAGGFFNAATTTVVATNSTAMVAATAKSVSVSGTIPSNATNIVVLYWTEATAAQNVTLDAWGMRLTESSTLVDHIKRTFDEELKLAERFCETSYEYGTAPGTATFAGAELWRRLGSETLTTFVAAFRTEKHSPPAITWYNPNTGTSGQIYNQSGPGNVTVTGTSTQKPTSTRFAGSPTHAANGSLGEIILGHWVARCRL